MIVEMDGDIYDLDQATPQEVVGILMAIVANGKTPHEVGSENYIEMIAVFKRLITNLKLMYAAEKELESKRSAILRKS